MTRYCEPIEVWDALNVEREGDRDKSETFSSVSDGETVSLSHKYLIGNAFLPDANSEISEKQDVIALDGSGNVQNTSDYSVDLRDGEVTWESGSSISTLEIRYKTGPLPNSVVVNKIEAATQKIDEKTNTTFGGTEFVTNEIYDGEGHDTLFYPFANRPVRSVHTVEINKADPGDSDDWKTKTSGRPNDYIKYSNIGIKFTTNDVAPADSVANLRVDYEYGYEEIPDEIRALCVMEAIKLMLNDQTLGEIIDGREGFDARITDIGFLSDRKEIYDRWTVERLRGVTTRAQRGR